MSRIATSNYLADADTQFVWATDDGDAFDREDVSYLARAVERHNHEPGRGVQLGIDSFADGIITSAKLGAGSVTESKIGAGAVTNAKLADGAVTAAKIGADQVNASHLAANSVGASEIVDGGVGTTEIANNAVTSAKLGVGSVVAHLGYTPYPTSGGNISDKVTIIGSFGGVSLEAAGNIKSNEWYDAEHNRGYRIKDSGGVIRPALSVLSNVLRVGDGNYGQLMLYGFAADSLVFQYAAGGGAGGTYPVWHQANDGAGSGLDADLLDGVQGAGYALAGHTHAGGEVIPAGLGAWVPTAGSIPAGWSRYSNLDGRVPVGAGTTFSVTFTENTNYGSSWSHSHSGGNHVHSAAALGISGNVSNPTDTEAASGVGGSVAADGHQHTQGSLDVNGTTDSSGSITVGPDAWTIPSRAVVWITKN